MFKLIIMPDGNAVSPAIIKSVQLNKKGVVCSDAQRRLIVWIDVTDEEKGKRVRDIMIRVANDGYRAQQPDWSFLQGDVKGGQD
jgi:hypothetical protein